MLTKEAKVMLCHGTDITHIVCTHCKFVHEPKLLCNITKLRSVVEQWENPRAKQYIDWYFELCFDNLRFKCLTMAKSVLFPRLKLVLQ